MRTPDRRGVRLEWWYAQAWENAFFALGFGAEGEEEEEDRADWLIVEVNWGAAVA
jgi:hypothetical protein